MSLLDLFCHVDDFCRQFVPAWTQLQLTSGTLQRQRAKQLSVSEIMTILSWFHCSHYRTFGSGSALTDALEIVSDDKQPQHPFVIKIALGKRQGLPHEAREALPERIVPTLDVIGLAALFAHGVMVAGRKDFLVGGPEIAKGATIAVGVGESLP